MPTKMGQLEWGEETEGYDKSRQCKEKKRLKKKIPGKVNDYRKKEI